MIDDLDEAGETILAYWESLSQAGEVPLKAAFDPVEVPKALPGVQIVEVDIETGELRYRLVGTREVDARGYDPTGMPVVEAFLGESAESVLGHYKAVIKGRKPCLFVEAFRTQHRALVEDVSLFLPMRGDGEDIQYILVYSYQRKPGSGPN